MSYKISKELFEAVTKNKTDDVELYIDKNSIRYWTCEENRARELYIDTFFFDCKEWALKQEICLCTGIEEHTPISYVFVCFQSNRYRPDPQSRFKNPLVEHKIQTPTMYGDNEKQCLFDACQWILDNKDKQ